VTVVDPPLTTLASPVVSVAGLAEMFVGTRRVVPGLTVGDDGVARSWWWPLPSSSDRGLLAALLVDNDVDDHDRLAVELSDEVDRMMRERLDVDGLALLEPRPGRRTVPDAWVRSLTARDPRLSGSLDAERVAAFAAVIDEWVRSGVVGLGRARLCIRIHEPLDGDSGDVWTVEAMAQDVEEPSLMVALRDLWEGSSPFGVQVIEELLSALGRMARIAPELSGLLDAAVPDRCNLDDDAIVELLQLHVGPLEDAGVMVLLPGWWANRSRLGLRARTRRSAKSDGAVTTAGFGFESIVDFTWKAALGDTALTAADLRSLQIAADAKRSLVRVRGMWVELRPDEIAALLAGHGTKGTGTAGELVRAGLGIDALEAPGDAVVVGVDASGWLGTLLDDALHSTVDPVPTPDGFDGELRPYQERGVGWLAFLGRVGLGACLADDMGLGKTAQVIASMLSDRVDGPTLVVCPTSVLDNWEREVNRFAPGLSVMVHHGAGRMRDHDEAFAARAVDHDVVLTSYHLVARDIDDLETVQWGRFVLDEAQQVKNPYTAQARAVHRLDAPRRIALTGTPVENRLSELWAIMHTVNPGLLGSARSFKRRFAGPIERDQDAEATDRLQRIVTPFLLRRLKSDRSIIDDLPDKVERTQRCPLTREQATLYQAVVDDLIEQAKGLDGIDRRGAVLAGIMKLKQVCNHPAHFAKDSSTIAGRSGKLARTEELLDQVFAAGDKALLFTQYSEWGTMLAPYLARRFGIEVPWLHGKLTRKRRDAIVSGFQDADGPPLLAISLKAGGTGLNLTAASHVVHYDRWWNPAVEDQATDRAYRIGQHRNVVVSKLVSSGTVEEKIDEMITSKRALAESVVGAGDRWITELSTDELRDVLTLRTDTIED
jgi:hypothetical protein